MIRIISAALLALALTACSAFPLDDNDAATKIAVQYATLKLISESDSVTSADVINHVERVRGVVLEDATLDVGELLADARANIDWASLDAADQMLIEALLGQVEISLGDAPGEVIDEDKRVRVLTLLDWIAQAAAMMSR